MYLGHGAAISGIHGLRSGAPRKFFPAWNLSDKSDFCWSFLGNHRLIPYSIKVYQSSKAWDPLKLFETVPSISTHAGNLHTFWTLVAVEGFADFWAVCSEDSKDGFGLVVGWCSLEGSRAFPLRLVISTLETQQFRCETRKKQDWSGSAPKLYISDWPLKGKTLRSKTLNPTCWSRDNVRSSWYGIVFVFIP
jgi:hypothetical protein